MANGTVNPAKIVKTPGGFTLELTETEAVVLREVLDGMLIKTVNKDGNTAKNGIGQSVLYDILEALEGVPETDDWIFSSKEECPTQIHFLDARDQSILDCVKGWEEDLTSDTK